MARGWESKSVESQIESLESRRPAPRVVLSPLEEERSKKRESLLMSRVRVVRDLEAAANPKYQEILRAAVKHLDDRLSEVE